MAERNDSLLTREFSVWQFFSEESYEAECRWVGAAEAVERFHFLTTNVAAKTGLVKKVIITDGGDNTTMEWKYGEGYTFPPEIVGKEFKRKKDGGD